MVASKSKKVLNYTYAERVLGSFTQIQREHKKHAVHLASLKTQVLKTANARKDKLGPHWKNWVGKAVHRLEEDGIFSSESAGTVALTAGGKKHIQDTRHSLGFPAHDSLSPDQEDLLWKQVTHSNAPRPAASPVKRPRHTNLSEDEDSEPEYVPPKRRKRPRTSVASSKTNDPAFKKTKAQLIEELMILKRAQEAERLRAASPLTELEEDESEEVMRLKEIIDHKDKEVHTLQSQLNARRNSVDVENRMSTPLRPLPNAVIRTHSGSFINQLSKQPTPAPTERDPDDLDDDAMFDEPEPESDFAPPFIVPLATPDASPMKVNSKNQTSSLEQALHLRNIEFQNLAHKLSDIQSQYTDMQKSLSDKNTRISTLQTNLAMCENQISDNDTAISRIPVLERAKADLEASMSEKAAEIQRLVNERQALMTNLEIEKNKTMNELSRLRNEVEAAHTTAESSESTIASLRNQLETQGAASAEFIGERARLVDELSAQRAMTLEAEASSQPLLQRIAELDLCIHEAKARELSLKEEVARVEAASLAASQKLSEAETNNQGLLARLAEADAKLTATKRVLTEMRAGAEALRPQMAALDEALTKRIATQRELQEQLTQARSDADNLRLKMGILETAGSNLRAIIESKKLEVEELRKELLNRTNANGVLEASLERKERQLTDLSAEKEELQSALKEVTATLEITRNAEADLRVTQERKNGQLAEADAAKMALMAELAASAAMLEDTARKLRDSETQAGSLETQLVVRVDEGRSLRVQLEESDKTRRALEQVVATAECKYAADIAERDSAYLALEASLSTAREEVSRLTMEADSLRKEREDVQSRLESDVSRLTDAFEAEQRRVKTVEEERENAQVRVLELEEELLALQALKDGDAATIEDLKDVLSQLKATHMQSLAKLDDKVSLFRIAPQCLTLPSQLESAQSTPVPRRRQSKIPGARIAA
ncbi:aminotransferase [Favolaschia claudopus]|uniref:Aminotransferase n=1 Tax=Favolaschia claudopus TaxID=2862362 RepID=A0AAW0D2J9_9AGAR